MRAHRLLLPLAAALAFLAGCGGGGAGHGSATPHAAVGFTIQWPVASARFIPANAKAIRITLTDGANNPYTQVALRPDAGGFSTLSFPDVVSGDCTAVAEAFEPKADPAVDPSEPIATGTSNFSLTDGQTRDIDIELGGTLGRVKVTGLLDASGLAQDVPIDASQSNGLNAVYDLGSDHRDLTIEPETGKGAMLLLDPAQFVVSVDSGDAQIGVGPTAGAPSNKIAYTVSLKAGASPGPVALKIFYKADSGTTTANQRTFTLKFNLAPISPASGSVTLSAARLEDDKLGTAIKNGLASLDATLVETKDGNPTGVTYVGTPNGTDPRKFTFPGILNRGTKFFARYTVRLLGQGTGYVDYLTNYDVRSQVIEFTGSSFGDNVVPIPASVFPTVTVPSQSVTVARGTTNPLPTVSVAGVQAVIGGSTVLLNPGLFDTSAVTSGLAAYEDLKLTGTGTGKPETWTVSAKKTTPATGTTYSGTIDLASTVLLKLSTSPKLTVKITPNDGHIGVGVG